MEKILLEYLEILNTERCVRKPNEAGIIIDKICQCFNEEQNQLTVGFLIGLIVGENNGIFAFIWKTCLNIETLPSTVAAFKLLEFLITRYRKCTEPYFCFLFEKCLYLLDTKFAKVKELSLKLVKKLIMSDSAVCFDFSNLTIKFEKHLREGNKIPGTVSEQIYNILGIIFEKYPELVKKQVKWFFLKIIGSLLREVTISKTPSVSRIKGAFEGINGYLVNYSFPDTESAKNIYECIKKLSQFQQEKRMLSHAAFKIFQNHWIHFAKFVYDDREYWKSCLTVWVNQSSEDRRYGFYVLCAFYDMLACVINQDSCRSEVLKNYLRDFNKVLDSGDSNFWEKKSALTGIKIFVLKNCLQDDDLNKSYQLVMNFVRNQEFSACYAYIPLCVECMSAFTLKFSFVDADQFAYLQKFSVMLISHYPELESDFQLNSLVALEKSFYTLGVCNLQILENHIEKIIYQGLIRSCSLTNLVDGNLSKGMGQIEVSSVSCKSYFSLWKYFLDLGSSSIMPADGSFTLKKGVAVKVFDSFINSFLKIVSKLNFNVKVKKSGLEEQAEVEMPSDFHIFINCIDLYQHVIPQTESFALSKWMIKIFKDIIYLSNKNPLVAGFYKIIATTLRSADSVQFFEDRTVENDKFKCFEMVHKFLEGVLLKVDQYKSDLQIACLQTLLAAPAVLIEGFVEKMVPVLEEIIRVGRGFFPLLKNMVEALERWSSRLPTSTMNFILQKTLPHFDLFFQSSNLRDNSMIGGNGDVKKIKSSENVSELLTLQKQFLIFLGNLDISVSMNLIELREAKNDERKINDKHVVYHLPFSKGKSEINLDEMLPRIIELAECCSDRKTRVAACELLYSTVMVILSYINQLSGGFTSSFRKIIRTCLILSCDSDSIVSQIFEPLMFQIIHYFSGKKLTHFLETQDLIDILTDYASRAYEPATRSFSAVLICEFTIWSIGQLTPEELKVTPDSINKILNHIYSLSLHPSYNKRLGAAVIFNKIYSVLREEDFILDNYWFQLFYHFMESLRMCDILEDVSEITKAIEHIKRPLIEKHEKFNEISSCRIVPPEFGGNLLSDLIKWTLGRCCDVRTSTRRTAMALVEELVPVVCDCGSLTSFIDMYLPEESFQINKEFVCNVDLTDENFIAWLNHHSSLFEYYKWLLKENVLTIEEVFQFELKTFSKKFLREISSIHEKSIAIELSKRESVLSFLNLLLAVGEKAFYFPVETWEILKICIFKPNLFGFDVSDATSQNESLFSILVDLLKFFSIKLTQYDWNNFYENVESLMSVPLLKYLLKNRYIDLESSEFLFALKVIENSGFWNVFMERMAFSIDGSFIVKLIFCSLFLKRGKNFSVISLEPSCKMYLEELLKLALKIGIDWNEIFRCLENAEEVRDEETGKTVKKGEYFQLHFNSIMYEFLEIYSHLLVDRVVNSEGVESWIFLIRMLQNKEGSQTGVGREIFHRWRELEDKYPFPERKKTFLLHLALGAARSISSPGCLKFSPIANLVYSSGGSHKFEEMDTDEVEGILSLFQFLPGFAEDLDENYRLNVYLSELNGSLFSNYVARDRSTAKDVVLQLAVNCLLQTLKFTGSLVILRFILTNFTSFKIFCKEREVQSALNVFVDAKMPSFHSIKALKLIYCNCFETEETGSAILLMYRWFLNPLLKKLPKGTVYDFVIEHLENFYDLITTPLSDDLLCAIRIEIVKKTCCSNIVRTFVSKFSKEELDGLPREKMHLMDKLVRNCFHLLKNPQPVKCVRESYRKFMCEVFNMICIIICARCTDEKIYKLFIFDERGSFLYEAVNKTVMYNLDMDFDEIPKRMKHLTLLRKNITPESQINSNKKINSIRYMQADTLFSSSLHEDITKFDLTYSPLCPANFFENHDCRETSCQMEIELEMDSLNNHECMATLVGVITKMVKEKITPLPYPLEIQSFHDLKLPCWLKFLLSVLKNSRLPANMKLFVLKCIYNVQDYAKPFSVKVFPDVLNSVLSLFKNSPINYFMIDLIEMMIGWGHIPGSEMLRQPLTNLVKLIMEKSDSCRMDIVKHNLEVLKMMIEIWKDCLVTSELSSFAFKLLCCSTEKNVKTNTSASDGSIYWSVHLCGLLLSNGISSWKEGSETLFFDLVLHNFHGSKYNEYFSQICGLALNHMEKTDHDDLNVYENLVREKISSEPLDGLLFLYGIHKHYPKISSRFVCKILTSAWNSVDSFTVKKLEMLFSHVCRTGNLEDDTFNQHAHVFLIDMLNSTDVTVQKMSLRIAEKLLDKMSDDKSNMLLKGAVNLHKSAHPDIRKFVYDISAKHYLKHQHESDVATQCKVILLRGLNDGVLELEECCLKFWCNFLDLSSPCSSLMQILKEMYTPETECIFLDGAVKILIQTSATSDLCREPIFPYPITHEQRAQKRNLIFTDKQMSLAGLMSNRIQSLESTVSLKNRSFSFLRPTINLEFEPTLQENSEGGASLESESLENPELPKNPFRRRFFKSPAKENLSFARWQRKKKKELTKDEEKMQEKETVLDIYGKYQIEDYPHIQINHFQILKPLEALAKRDHQIPRQFLVSFYSGLMKSVSENERMALILETNKFFEKVFKVSTTFDPGFFGFVFQILLKYYQNLEIDCQLISKAAISSNWLSLGALSIEQIIGCKEDSELEEVKRRRENGSPQEKRWLELAKLYRSLKEFDVVSGIFLDKLRVVGDEKEAILSEVLLDWSAASKYYESVLKSDSASPRNEFYVESYFLCLAKLSNWSCLSQCIRTTVDENLTELWKNFNLLSWFLKSEMMMSLGSDSNEFRLIMEEFCQNKSKVELLNVKFGEELAVFNWLSGDLEKAIYRIDGLYLDFLAGWAHLNKWCYNLRATKLTNLETLSELNYAVRVLAEKSKSQSEQIIKLGMKRWEKMVPTPRDDLMIWDMKLNYRRKFLNQLKQFDWKKSVVKSNLELVKAAYGQDNLSLAEEYLGRVKENLPEVDVNLKTEYDYYLNIGKMMMAKHKINNENSGLEIYTKVWREISSQIVNQMDTDSENLQVHVFRCNLALGKMVSEIVPLVANANVSPETLKFICAFLQSFDHDPKTVIKTLKNKGLEYFETARKILENLDGFESVKSNTYLELIKFHLKFSDLSIFANFERLGKYLLKSMSLGNAEARQLFGCFLNTFNNLDMEETPTQAFKIECDFVPSWMFLMWINQILASLNFKTFSFLKSIILRIAQDYPNAIRYAFKISNKKYESENLKAKDFTRSLNELLLNDKQYENFWNSMNYLSPPDLILKHYLENVLEEVNQENPNFNRINSILIEAYELMFSTNYDNFRGPVFKFWEKFKYPIESLMGTEEGKEIWRSKIKDILVDVESSKSPSRRTFMLLESYSPWLCNFHSLKADSSLELPGQYDGNRKPIKKYLVKISSFKHDVMVFNSKRRPMKITILGNDAQEHKYLVKFGEDPRQDQRIQQVFGHFNHRFNESKQTRRFSVDTFTVIPLTFSLGMIEWVENSISLHEMIENSLGKGADLISKAQSRHLEFLGQSSAIRGIVAAHLFAYENIRRDSAISNFKVRVQEFTQDLLKKSLWNLSTSPEHFIYLRTNFATSHAVMCITHWLIGIGDRHLQNTLVSTTTGRVVGIDFGYAFGFATQFLTPPELIPFRLTPQILNLMHPLNESGWIKQTMIYCLRLFRKKQFMLLSILEVFALEPVMDWLNHAKKSPRCQEGNSDSWCPRQKISIVEKKLCGINPISLFEADLRAGHFDSKFLTKYLEVLKGTEQHNFRARCNLVGLTEEEQVECLIDLATDPHVLAKTYVGWNSWL